MSRSRCSTPTSSASAALISVGICVNVFALAVPSWSSSLATAYHRCHPAYIVHFVNGKIGVRRETELLGLDVNDHEHGMRREPADDLVDLEIAAAQFWPRVVPANNALARWGSKQKKEKKNTRKRREKSHDGELGIKRRWIRTVNLAEHVPHVGEVVMVKEPDAGVLLVLLKRNSKAVCHVNCLALP